jgi:hypothetical protein
MQTEPVHNAIPDPAKLPHLLRLLDDPSHVVRDAVRRELLAYGTSLGDAVAGLHTPLDRAQSARLRTILSETAAEELRCRWPLWQDPALTPLEQLELALTLIADFQDHASYALSGDTPVSVCTLLDELAAAFDCRGGAGGALELAVFLFEMKGFQGAVREYYDPRNSNIRQVILRRHGIPISLAAVYMLVGGRLGMEITGCNWPGHFLARVREEDRIVLVDCYNEGRHIEMDAFLSTQGPSRAAARKVIEEDTPIPVMIGRVVNNLVRAYQEAGHWEHAHLLMGLLRDTERFLQQEGQREDIPPFAR